MLTSPVRNKATKLANNLFASGDYCGALEIYYKLSKKIGSKFFYMNIAICLNRLLREGGDKIRIREFIDNNEFDIFEKLYSDRIIVSLTSYPGRIDTVEFAIKSILDQSYKASKVVLWLAGEQFPKGENDLPASLLSLKREGLEIEWCEDLRSYKKLIPALTKYPEKIIVTADDDIIYGKNWLLKLLLAYIENPFVISCHRVHCVSLNGQGELLDYRKWPQDIKDVSNSFANFFTGCGGVLYPPHSLKSEVLNKEIFANICPDGDDIWFWAMAVLNDTRIQLVKNSDFKIEFTPGSQETALWKSNVNGGHNNKLLASVFERYPVIRDKLLQERMDSAPKISVIIPIYNPGGYLNSCLESLSRQEFADFEVICVDDGSTDKKTSEILATYAANDNRFKVLKQKNSGPATARNNGFRYSRGEYISFVDADDYVSRDFIGGLYKAAKESQSDIAVVEEIVCFDDEGASTSKQSGFENFRKSRAKDCATAAILATGVSWNKIYRRKFLIENDIFYMDGMKCHAEDNYFSAAAIIAAGVNISVAKGAIYYWRQHGSSITKNITRESLEESAHVYEILKEKLSKANIVDKTYWLNVVNKRALRDLRYSARNIDVDDNFFKSLDQRFASTIDVCCIADENYVVPTMVFLESVRRAKNSTTKLSITILVPQGAKEKMISLEKLSSKGFRVNLVEVNGKQFDNLHKYKDNDNFCMASPSAMFKFIIPDIFKNLDRILYIDTDLIVRKDLMDLFMTTMDNDYMCAVVDMWAPVTTREDIKGFKNYFNSGMMLMNLRKMREENLPERLICAKMNATNFNLMDQDVFNEVCAGKVRMLDIKFNFLPVCYKRHKNKFDLSVVNRIYNSNYKTIEEVAHDPVVVHWAGSDKPWVTAETLFSNEWINIHSDLRSGKFL